MVQPSIVKSHKHPKIIETFFYHFVFHNDWLKNHCSLSVKSMTPNFVDAVSVALPIYCHNGSGMPYQYIYVND